MTSTHIQDEVQDEVILREENVRALHLEDNLPQADLLLGRHLLRHFHGWVILRLELDLDSLAIYIQCTLDIWRVRAYSVRVHCTAVHAFLMLIQHALGCPPFQTFRKKFGFCFVPTSDKKDVLTSAGADTLCQDVAPPPIGRHKPTS